MQNRFGGAVLAVLGLSLGAVAQDVPEGFQPLFNGQDLTGWWGAATEDPRQWMALSEEELAAKIASSIPDIQEHWSVEDGVLVNDGQGLYLTTTQNFRDFELRLDYRTVAGADSGIYLRGCPQVQIWDTTEAGGKWDIGADKGSGGLWNNAPGAPGKNPLVHADKPFGEWNSVRILMIGEYVTVHLNDQLVVDQARMENYFDRSLPIPAEGPIQLQTHGGEIAWRDIVIREIGVDEANAYLMARDGEDFEPIFNGENLQRWAGALDGYEVIDGILQCKEGAGGTIYTYDEYSDFDVQLMFKLPPAGNNGLAIRYPGHGDTAYSGMCELQILDSTHPRYKDLDPRQHHGSAYGMAAAHRGYLRQPGEWNFQRVRVVGSTIQVELNGTRILDADIAAITDFMYAEHRFAGRDNAVGHFGFAGHASPVAYKHISIRPLTDEDAP